MAKLVVVEQAMKNVDVKFPEERANLVESLKYLANSRTEPTISKTDNGRLLEYYDFDMAVHQIFDDMGSLAVNPDRYIGIYLKNETEARAIFDLVATIEIVLSKNLPDQIDFRFVETPEWTEVIKSARVAVAAFESA